jgi:Putative MetA-pathway of phenol degradation
MHRRRSLMILLVAAAVVAWCAIPCQAEWSCGGPNTLFNWNGCPSSGGNGGGDSGKDAGDDSSKDDSPFSHPISADRPGFGDTPTTVGCGVCQVELGYQYTYDHEDGASHINHSYPQSLLRVGTLANWFEVRVSWSMEQETDRVFGVASETAVGSDDMNVGFKIALTDQADWLPQMGVVGDMYVPTGSSAFTAGEVLPEIEWIYEWNLNKKLSVTGVTFLTDSVDSNTSNTYLTFSQGIETDYSITDALVSYINWHVSSPAGADTNHTQEVLEGGVTLLLNNNVVADAEAGVGLNDATPDYYVGGGISFRH